jgi:hypothetical protein
MRTKIRDGVSLQSETRIEVSMKLSLAMTGAVSWLVQRRGSS